MVVAAFVHTPLYWAQAPVPEIKRENVNLWTICKYLIPDNNTLYNLVNNSAPDSGWLAAPGDIQSPTTYAIPSSQLGCFCILDGEKFDSL